MVRPETMRQIGDDLLVVGDCIVVVACVVHASCEADSRIECVHMVSAENADIRIHELFETSHRLLGVSRSIKRASQVVTGSQGIGMIWTFETLVVVYIFLVHGDHVVVLLECFMHVSGKDMGDNSVRGVRLVLLTLR